MFNVAIDGTTSSGKSTLAQNLSKVLGYWIQVRFIAELLAALNDLGCEK